MKHMRMAQMIDCVILLMNNTTTKPLNQNKMKQNKENNDNDCTEKSGAIVSVAFVPMMFKQKEVSHYVEEIITKKTKFEIKTGKTPDSIVMHPKLVQFLFENWIKTNHLGVDVEFEEMNELSIYGMRVIQSKDLRIDDIQFFYSF